MDTNWSNAEDWVTCHAFDGDGTGWYYEDPPIIVPMFRGWFGDLRAVPSGWVLPADLSWRDSLVYRGVVRHDE